ncbi:MAG: hypothetical protein ACFFCV_04430 [Promethearchaeota archaeon]
MAKILILIFGTLSFILGFGRLGISGVVSNPTEILTHNFYLGVIPFPSRISGSGYGIGYNFIIFYLFIIIYIVGFILNFGYFKRQKRSKLRDNLDLISIILMSIGLVGSVISPILTLLRFEIPPTTITSFSFNLIFLSGFYMAIITILLILVEYVFLEKTRFFKND